MKKVFFFVIINLITIYSIKSQGLKGHNLGGKSVGKFFYITVGGIKGTLLLETLNDGTTFQLFFSSSLEDRGGASISLSEFNEFGINLQNHLGLELVGGQVGNLTKALDGDYVEYKGKKNNLNCLLRFGDFIKGNNKNELRCWIWDDRLEQINKREEINNKKNDY